MKPLLTLFACGVVSRVSFAQTSDDTSIPNTPWKICFDGYGDSDVDDGYDLADDDTYWEAFYSTTFLLNDQWVVYNSSTDLVTSFPSSTNDDRVFFWCDEMPTDYTPTSDDMGDPTDCLSWTNEDISVDTNTNCEAWDTALSWIDWAILGYAAVIIVILLLHMLPFGPFNERCQKATYDGALMDTYSEIMKQHGLNPQEARSKQDKRTLVEVYMKNDLLRGKVVWQNDIKQDWYLYLRNEHACLSLCYVNRLHPYSPRERIVAFIGVQFVAMGIACYITRWLAEDNVGSPEVGFIIGFILDWLFGFVLAWTERWFERCATCKGAERRGPCIRKCAGSCGHCGMLFFLAGCIGAGVALISSTIETVYTKFDDSDAGAITLVIVVNYLTGLIFAWFLIDFAFTRAEFLEEWHRQKGEEPPKGKCENIYCCMSWMTCMCCIYYLFCKKMIEQDNEREYAKDENGEVIGSQDGQFAVTWQEYQAYKDKQPLKPKDLARLATELNIKSPTMQSTSQPKSPDIEMALQSATTE